MLRKDNSVETLDCAMVVKITRTALYIGSIMTIRKDMITTFYKFYEKLNNFEVHCRYVNKKCDRVHVLETTLIKKSGILCTIPCQIANLHGTISNMMCRQEDSALPVPRKLRYVI
jgi:hypothetical protein